MHHYSPNFREIPKNTHTKDVFDEKTYSKTLPATMPEPILNKQSDDFDRFGLNTRSSRRDERIKTESARLHEIESYIPTDLRVPKYINQNTQSNAHNNSNGTLYNRLKFWVPFFERDLDELFNLCVLFFEYDLYELFNLERNIIYTYYN